MVKRVRAKKNISTLASVVAPAALAVTMSTVPTEAVADDFFLKVDGVVGEVRDEAHKGEIDVLAWSWGMSRAVSSGAGGGTRSEGQVNFQDVSFTKYVDKSSAVLMLHCANGKHIPEAVLTVRDTSSANPMAYFKVTMEDVLVSSVSSGGSAAGNSNPDVPSGDATFSANRHTENVTLNFARVQVEYTPFKEDGSPGAVEKFGWDIQKNQDF